MNKAAYHLKDAPREAMFGKIGRLLYGLVKEFEEIHPLSMHEKQHLMAEVDELIDPIHKVIKDAYAPHLRGEFPREAVGKAALDWANSDNDLDSLVNALERVVNGGERPDKIGELVCPTCGGRGEVPDPQTIDQIAGLIKARRHKPCPDCTEKCRHLILNKIDGKSRCNDCGEEIFTRRDGHNYLYLVDQRKGRQRHGSSVYQRKIGGEHYPSPDERKGQRRQGEETRIKGTWPDDSIKRMFSFEGFLNVSMLDSRTGDRRD